jgi:hypothetical protein
MMAHARPHSAFIELTETELFAKIQLNLISRYSIEPKLASEMAWDLIDVLTAVDSDIDIFEKYFLQ